MSHENKSTPTNPRNPTPKPSEKSIEKLLTEARAKKGTGGGGGGRFGGWRAVRRMKK